MSSTSADRGICGRCAKVVLSTGWPLSKALGKKFGLSSAIVVTPPRNSDESAHMVVARLASRLLPDLIAEDDIVGLGPGRTIVQTCELIVDVPTCDVVQLTGVATPGPETNLTAIMRLSQVVKGRMFPLCAPFLATDTASARTIAAQPAVRQALQRMDPPVDDEQRGTVAETPTQTHEGARNAPPRP